MALAQTRERWLAAAVLLLLVGFGLSWLVETLLRGPQAVRQRRIETLRGEVEKKEQIIRRARVANAQLDEWNARSLPADVAVARSLYQSWLLELVGRSGFEQPNVDSGEAAARKGVFRRLPFTVRGRANLAEVTRFLYDFYRADHLHQVQRIGFSPAADGDKLDISVSIEALVLPGAKNVDALSSERSTRLASDALADYQSIADRNVFGEGGASAFDSSDFAFLTAILDVDGKPEAWFTVRTTGEVLKLREGQLFEVGQFRGMVEAIDATDLIINSDEERWLLTLGENLSRASALPPEF